MAMMQARVAHFSIESAAMSSETLAFLAPTLPFCEPFKSVAGVELLESLWIAARSPLDKGISSTGCVVLTPVIMGSGRREREELAKVR